MTFRIATYNIHRCIGQDNVQSPERIAALLREIDADMIALQEVSALPNSSENVLELLEEAADAKAIQGFTLQEKDGLYGNALLSRHEISKIELLDISIAGREPRGVIAAELDINHCKVAVLATHLGLSSGERRYQVRRLLSALETTFADIIILLGDFNEWFFLGRPLRWLKQHFEPLPALATFPAHRPLFGLDRIWIHPTERVISLEAYVTELSRVASDHLPLVAEIEL